MKKSITLILTALFVALFITACACPPDFVQPPTAAERAAAQRAAEHAPAPARTTQPAIAPEESELPPPSPPIIAELPGEAEPEPILAEEMERYRIDINPEIGLSSILFNPYEDDMTFTLPVLHSTPVARWSLEVHEPIAPFLIFHEWTGQGQPPNEVIWDGKNFNDEWIHSASDYPLVFTATDIHGNTRSVQGRLMVDVFVIEDELGKRIVIPSIVFGPNQGGWDGLDPATFANNQWIMSRLVLALNTHSNYQVRIEGHANYTVAPTNIAGRQREQTAELQPLSEMRANTIMQELILRGITEGRLSAYGVGGARPVADWDDHDNWWKNRRVEFILVE